MKSRHLAILPVMLALAACANTPTVNYDADPSANFAAYKTYSWAYQKVPDGVNPLIADRVRTSIDNSLAARGYTKADPGDFAVGFTIGSRDRVEVNDMGVYGPFYRPWGGWGGWAGPQVDVRNVTDGTLVIDVYDTGTKSPVWHGTATQEVTKNSGSQENIDSAVNAVLAKFPPPPKK
ncbi:DUF4136 domain-containing protein [Sphingopyxis indica]|uniref:DUF4136 domain-containing protein n=1 Tax=Sphingopyxis indica TaxID=436663 RepID=A0A239DEN5_9SPHN|nr:DUF4136 domain-containing protein [Sphingopyxis indica]WOF44661.1 DUF4136 domain-containing protein [Sphingopyxis indica]SNS30294.1 protein of unknown function [Sphingopyxis indica]